MNTKHYKILVWLVLVLLVLNISALGTILWFRFAQKPPMRDAPMKEKSCFRMHDDFIREEIGLNDAQMDQFVAIRDKHFAEIRKISEEVRNTRKYQFHQLRNIDNDKSAVDSLNGRIGELHRLWSESSARFLTDAGAICSPEQRDKMFDMLEKSRKEEGFRSMKHFDRGRDNRDSTGYPGERKPQRGQHRQP